jgi:phospholipase C
MEHLDRGPGDNGLSIPTLSRRQLLAAGIAGAAGFLLSACTGSTVHKAATTPPAGSDLGAVEHVIFLMQENRSFDHYFGSYRGVRGFGNHPAGSLGAFAQPWLANTIRPPLGSLLPFHLDTNTTDAECTFDLTHAWGPQQQSWNGGRMDRFVEVHTNPANEGPDNGLLTMGYYTRSDLPFHYALADAFTICDGYHCSVFGPTHPNRLHWISGTLDPSGKQGGPVLVTNSDPSKQFSLSWTTMPERLQAKGVSWKVYNPPGSEYQPHSASALLLSDNVLLYFKQYADPSSALYKQAFGPTYPNDFATDVANNTLPAVSWIIPGVLPQALDEHPPGPPSAGAWLMNNVISTLASNPKVWSKTVLFISYDENDGFFDHVPPPTPPPGTSGEYLTVDPLPADAKGISGPIGLGMRVPMLVVSPFSRGGYVCSDTFDHTSQLRFLETRFGVEVPNLTSWRRSVTGDLTSALRLSSPNASVPSLPAVSTTPDGDPKVTRECQAPELIEVDVSGPPYALPATQSMPTQESGPAKHVPTR